MLYPAVFSTFMQYCVCSVALGFLLEDVEFDFLNHSVIFLTTSTILRLLYYCFVLYREDNISHHRWDFNTK